MDFYNFILTQQYSPACILYLDLPLNFTSNGRSTKRKFLVFADDKEPPLFFVINSKSRHFGRVHQLELHKHDYDFLTNEISYLDYEQEYQAFDIDVSKMPTKADIIELLKNDRNTYKGHLTQKDAEALLFALENEELAISDENLERFIHGLKNFLAIL